jgi:MFS transporter, OFA family, oxalate/formate antiporter
MPDRLFYGWIVVAAAFAVTFIGFGCAYTFSAFVQPLQSEFGASRGSVALAFSLSGFVYFGFGLVSGPLADRWGARRLAMLGMLLVGSGLALASQARSLFQVYLSYGLGVGLGIGCAYVPVIGTVQRWFDRRRGLASGLAVAGIGVGTLVMPPVAATLIELFGWRPAYLVIGVGAAVLGVVVSSLIVSDPSERGLHPDGTTHSHEQALVVHGTSLREAVRSAAFKRMYLACFMGSLGVFVPFVHLVPYAQDIGIEAGTAAALIATIGAGSTAGRFFLGGVADRMGRVQFLRVTYLGMMLAMLLWAVAGSLPWLVTFAAVLGIFYGGWVAVLPAVVMDLFGRRNVSSIIGVLYTSVAFGTLIGPTAAGFLFDMTSSYLWPILAAVAANLAAALVTGGRSPARSTATGAGSAS